MILSGCGQQVAKQSKGESNHCVTSIEYACVVRGTLWDGQVKVHKIARLASNPVSKESVNRRICESVY
jgi:hypothetical protein